MRIKAPALFLSILAAGVLSRPLMAEGMSGSLELGLDTGYVFLGSGAFESDIDAGTRLGARIGFHVTDHLEVEGHYAYSRSAADCGLFSCSDVETTLRTFVVNALYNFNSIMGEPEGTVIPYVLAGIGNSSLEFDGDLSARDESRAYQLGVGGRMYLKRFAMRGEILVMQDDTFDDRSHHLSFGLGFCYALPPLY